jgi:hypothetical protein
MVVSNASSEQVATQVAASTGTSGGSESGATTRTNRQRIPRRGWRERGTISQRSCATRSSSRGPNGIKAKQTGEGTLRANYTRTPP